MRRHAARRRTVAARLADHGRHRFSSDPRASKPEHRSRRAKIAAPESPGHQFQGEDRRQDRGRHARQMKRHRAEREQMLSHERFRTVGRPAIADPAEGGVGAAVKHRIAPECQPAHQQREGIDETDQRKREDGGQQHRDRRT